MSGVTTITSTIALIDRDNIDTDAIMPSRELTQASRVGLADSLFAGWRYTDEAKTVPRDDFILNQEPFEKTQIILSGENFGCGSSREFAVWALVDFGIKAILAKSFGSIFLANCIRNDIAPLVLAPEEHERLRQSLLRQPSQQATLDLASQTLALCDGTELALQIDATSKQALLTGRDEIAITLEQRLAISAWREADIKRRPWLY